MTVFRIQDNIIQNGIYPWGSTLQSFLLNNNCVAWYRFGTDDITKDSIGDNSLTHMDNLEWQNGVTSVSSELHQLKNYAKFSKDDESYFIINEINGKILDGNYLYFNGSTAGMTTNTNHIPTDSDFTVEVFISVEQLTSGNHIIINSPNNGFSLYSNTSLGDADENVRFWDINKGQIVYDSTYDLRNSYNWTHIALSREGDVFTLYINGEPTDSNTVSGSLATGSYLNIGYRGEPDNDRYHYGKMTELRFWNHARSERQININMCKRMTGREDGLIAYYPLNEGKGTETREVVSNTNITIDSSLWQNGDIIDDISLTRQFSVSCWFRIPYYVSTSELIGLLSKYDTNSDDRTITIRLTKQDSSQNQEAKFNIIIGNDHGSSYNYMNFEDYTILLHRWYHLLYSVDYYDHYFYIWDAHEKKTILKTHYISSYLPSYKDAVWQIGLYNAPSFEYYNNLELAEMMIFNNVLSLKAAPILRNLI